MSSYTQLAIELAKTSELLQNTYALLRQRDAELQALQHNSVPDVETTTDLLKLLYASHEDEYVP